MKDWQSKIVSVFKDTQTVVEGTVWKRALTLAENVPTRITDEGKTVVVKGGLEEAAQALAAKGIVKPSDGKPYASVYLGDLRQAGVAAKHLEELREFPVRLVRQALDSSDQDAEQALLLLKAQGDKARLHDMAGTLVSGTPTKEDAQAILDRLPASERATVATGLVAQTEVQEQIRAGGALVTDVHLGLTDKLVQDSERRSRDHHRGASTGVRDIEASRLYSDAAKLMADGNAMLFQHARAEDDLYRCDAAIERIKGHVKRYREIRNSAPSGASA